MPKSDEKKTTNEKPVSLAPLDLKEALGALLKVKPQPMEKPPRKRKPKQQKKPSG